MLSVQYLAKANEYLEGLSDVVRMNIRAHVEYLRLGNHEKVVVKQLRRPVQELIVGEQRIVYFCVRSTLYIVSVFRKRSRKTPKNEIENAMKLYNLAKHL